MVGDVLLPAGQGAAGCLLEHGLLGVKTGAGFRCWSEDVAAALRARVIERLAAENDDNGVNA